MKLRNLTYKHTDSLLCLKTEHTEETKTCQKNVDASYRSIAGVQNIHDEKDLFAVFKVISFGKIFWFEGVPVHIHQKSSVFKYYLDIFVKVLFRLPKFLQSFVT